MKLRDKKKARELLQKLTGIHTISSIMNLLKVNRDKAIYYVHRLRKQGYVKTRKNAEGKRVYYISLENKLKGRSYIDVINENSPINLYSSVDFKIYGKSPSLEDTLIYSLKSKDFRIILASLALFKRITKWKELYALAKKNSLKRQICALYELSRKFMKVRKMHKLFLRNSLPNKDDKFVYIIKGLKSIHFKDIEKKWKIYIPFSISDLEAYKK